MFNYTHENTIIHRLCGLTKLLGFLILTGVVMYTYDIRIFLFILVFSFTILKIARISLKKLKLVFIYVGFFILINFILTFIFNPNYGPELYGTSTPMFTMTEKYTVTREQLFYQISKVLKYSSVIPLGIIFLTTTDPGEFASSLNRIFIPYKVAFAISLTLRYFPDILREYSTISKAQQARGLDISRKTSLLHRFRNALATIVPLIFTSLDRIDLITNALHLRGFSKHKRRTWYSYRPFNPPDYTALLICLLILAGALIIALFMNKGRFYNPFI